MNTKKNKALLYFPTEVDNPINMGLNDKFKSQMQGFKNNGFEVDSILHFNEGIIFNGKKIYFKKNIFYKVLKSLKPIIGYYVFFFMKKINFLNYDILYFRYKTSTPIAYFLLKKIKKQNPDLKIVLEFPTFPFYKEFKGIKYKIYFLLENQINKTLKKYVSYSSNYTNYTEIYGIKSISISNGFNYDLLEFNIPKKVQKENQYCFMAMASSVEPCHGFDRILLSFNSFRLSKPELTLKLTIVGDGKEINNIKNLTSKLGLNQYVIFTGLINNSEMYHILKEIDFCFSTMAMFRKDLKHESPLKTVYFCIAGKPFAISGLDSRFNSNFKYCYRVPNDNSIIDFQGIITFLDELRTNDPDFSSSMYKYAINELSWETQIKKILTAL